MFKTYTGKAPQIMNEVFPRNCASIYNLRRHPEFASRAINTVHYGSESKFSETQNMGNVAS